MNSKSFEAAAEFRSPKSEVQIPKQNLPLVPSSTFPRPASLLEYLIRIAVLVLALLCLAASSAQACGPLFPNSFLDSGDKAVLVAPTANFSAELARMNLVQSNYSARPLDAGGGMTSFADQSESAELADLRAALEKANPGKAEIERICSAHAAERKKLKQYNADRQQWQIGEWGWDAQGNYGKRLKGPSPEFPRIQFVPGLPVEFSDYFEGAVEWDNPALADKSMARQAWERLLARPANERQFKSTWAAFMLGRSWRQEAPDKAITYFKQVCNLAKHGFADSIGLAAASLGLEAQIYFKRGELARAIQLYLQQFATGDQSAAGSLRLVAAAALEKPDSLFELAKDNRAQRVITAYLVSNRGAAWSETEEQLKRDQKTTLTWLDAVEKAGSTDVEAGEKLALAAYQAGSFDEAQRWINRARPSPVTRWLQAKLWLRDGKVNQAAALIAKVCRSFPLESLRTNAPERFADNLSVGRAGSRCDLIRPGRQILGELGVLHLARRDYTEALDALLRSGFWMDAAYVAEDVLTVDELKRYVDQYWPLPNANEESEQQADGGSEIASAGVRERIRYLLARRLMRSRCWDEARQYFPAEWLPKLDELVQSLATGWNKNLPDLQRARALFTAAGIARTNGMELLGTELAPDWAIYDGDYEYGLNVEFRTNANTTLLPASEDELSRASRSTADPVKRFHYRYQASSLAWVAAGLMPNNSDETARMLCTAGTWLKVRDPQAADIYYKTLVRRCRKTAIGDQADRMRWFPVLDENGNPKPYKPRWQNLKSPIGQEQNAADETAPSDVNAILSEYPVPGGIYTVHSGDSLVRIAKAAGALGGSITVRSLIEANPGLDATRLRVGQRLLIPDPANESESTPDPAQP